MQDKKQKLQTILGKIIKKNRQNKSINRLSNEIELSKSIWSDLEKGKKDIQFSTLWRIAEALEIRPSFLVKEIEDEMGVDFSFIEE